MGVLRGGQLRAGQRGAERGDDGVRPLDDSERDGAGSRDKGATRTTHIC